MGYENSAANNKKIAYADAVVIRNLSARGYNSRQIQIVYPQLKRNSIRCIILGRTWNNG